MYNWLRPAIRRKDKQRGTLCHDASIEYWDFYWKDETGFHYETTNIFTHSVERYEILDEEPEKKKYRKRPVVIEAMQLKPDKESIEKVIKWINETENNTTIFNLQDLNPAEIIQNNGLWILTLEGMMKVSLNDFVICGIDHEFYPCKYDIFLKTYEEV